ncbi:MAG: hypothetical protein ACLUGA_12445, partial [Oscillospiraceae bacterium]
PKKWGRIAGQANDHRPKYRRTRTNVKKKARACRKGEGVVKSTWAGCGIFSKALALFFKCSHLYVIVRG